MHAGLPFHPLSNAYRLLKGAEYAALVEDVRQRGLLAPITLYEEQVLDGRNRQRACLEAGQPLLTVTYEGDDPLGHMLALNSHRRHDNESQRAMAATRVATLGKGGDPNAHRCALTQDEAADRFSVSRRLIQYARAVLEDAEPEIIEAVEDGEMTVKVAAALAGQSREKQLARLERDRRKANGTYRHTEDYYRTPPQCILALLRAERFESTVWEPACGDGAISRVLEAHGHTVISSDIVDRGYGEVADFLAATELRANDLITNPPYNKADEFALHALALGARKVALLCRLAWLEGQERYERLYSQQKLARVWIFSPRQTLWRGDDDAAEDDGGMTPYAWFVFEWDHNEGYNHNFGFNGAWLRTENLGC